MTEPPPEPSKWVEEVQRRFPGAEFFGPKDERSPLLGSYVVQGPTTEWAFSDISMEHAAASYLSSFYEDLEARAAAIAILRDHHRLKR